MFIEINDGERNLILKLIIAEQSALIKGVSKDQDLQPVGKNLMNNLIALATKFLTR